LGGGSGCARYCQKLTVVSVSRDTGSTRDDGWIAVVGQPAGNPHRAPHLFLIVGAGGDPGDRVLGRDGDDRVAVVPDQAHTGGIEACSQPSKINYLS